ncbi:hypothetical protein F5878DRAFT_667023 [Lentinula raphanica]|uniref:Uncharacterized protein n=1 Tax=Lentinula raphanica TaxID=153919 RepID=A0AA38U402_9AGAR|nr:hypothetical protein F5878DRAFT_667023 [Lentinula raphanica]
MTEIPDIPSRLTYTSTASWSTPTPTDPSSSSSHSGKEFSSDCEKFVIASQGSSDYITARTPSSEASFKSLPSIPSEYTTASESLSLTRLYLNLALSLALSPRLRTLLQNFVPASLRQFPAKKRSAPPSAPPSEASSQVPSIVTSSPASLPPPPSTAPPSVTERAVSSPS